MIERTNKFSDFLGEFDVINEWPVLASYEQVLRNLIVRNAIETIVASIYFCVFLVASVTLEVRDEKLEV